MRWILDANALIYLVKTNLQDQFKNLSKNEIVIDSSVYEESVVMGIKHGHDDAHHIKEFLEENRIPIIPVDVSRELHIFKDAGETSCYLLGILGGICITADTRAIKKLKQEGARAIHLDGFFYRKAKDREITRNEFEEILEKLEIVYATTPERKHELLKHVQVESRNEQND